MLLNKLYFYTSTIYKWKYLIGNFHFEQIIIDSLSYLHKKECIKVYGFVIMHNHIHLLWQMTKNNGKESPAASLMKFTAHQFEQHLRQKAPDVLRTFKVEDNSRRYNFWQANPDWFLLNQIPTVMQKLQYIHENPLQEHWKLCKRAVDYPYSSARFYVSGDSQFDFLHRYNEFVESEHWVSFL